MVMNTPKTFEPVVTEAMNDAIGQAHRDWLIQVAESCYGGGPDIEGLVPMTIKSVIAHPDFQRQLRAYAAEVARAMVPERRVVPLIAAFDKHFRAEIESFNNCRAATLSAIDEWEKNNG